MKGMVSAMVMLCMCVSMFAVISGAQEMSVEDQQKNAIRASIVQLRNKDTRVAVLQQLLSQEMNSYMQMQAVFCDNYDLNPEMFRAGKYVYDDEQASFVERPEEEASSDEMVE